MSLVVVILTVLLNIASALLLKTLAGHEHFPLFILVSGIMVAAFLGSLRFLLWGYAHKKYPLSTTYPLSSVFFPLMLVVSYVYGDPIYFNQLGGTTLITAGVLWMTLRVKS